jgi:two-component system cell cycle sensor histidine kinase/response regulator CckA
VAGVLRLTSCAREHELEEALGQAQRLHEVGELAGGIAHDFNNLLTAILGAVEDLTAHAAEADLEDLAQIRASAGRGAQLVRQILAFGQRQTMLPRVLVLDDAVTQAAQLLRRLLGRNVTLELDLQAPKRRVMMDATQLDQVLVNLAVNARNAMTGGGILRIATGWRMVLAGDGHEADALPPGRYATIEVSDTGGGIAPDVLPRIFDPFFTTRRGQGGTGLGLSMVQGIVAQSGGTLSVHSVVGEGTRFCITLPRHEGSAEVISARPPSLLEPPARREAAPDAESRLIGTGPARRGDNAGREEVGRLGEIGRSGEVGRTGEVGRVLLVDDDDAIRRLAKRTLSRAGWSVIEADGAEAALAVDLEAIDCVVSDVSMPGMDGPSLVRTLRESRANLPALLISGYADAEQRRSLAGEDIAFLAKPFAMAELSGTIARLLPPRVGVLDVVR